MEIGIWQYRAIDCPMLAKTLAELITLKNQRTLPPVQIVQGRESPTEFAPIVVFMMAVR
jgi:hypothetical protein